MKRNQITENKKVPRGQSIKGPGLCATCLNESACTYVRPDGVAVIFCEEFDTTGELRNLEPSGVGSVLQRVVAIVESEKDALPVPKKLCINCATSGECVYSHFGDNRWFCEEYS